MDIWAKKLIYTVDIWATQFHLFKPKSAGLLFKSGTNVNTPTNSCNILQVGTSRCCESRSIVHIDFSVFGVFL
jgi:hypothetical protein